jgi:hypothetical protein
MTRRGMLLSLGAVGAIVLLVAGAGLLPAFLNPSRSPAAASASPSASSARTQDPTRYDDGIPREWEGQPVLRVQAALDRAAQSTDATSFYIGLWYSSQPPSWGCPPTEPTPLSCTALHDVGDRAGVLWPALGRALRIEVDASDGPIVLRVHTHDPRWSNPANCAAAELDACVHLMIGDGIAWNGDAVTAPVRSLSNRLRQPSACRRGIRP